MRLDKCNFILASLVVFVTGFAAIPFWRSAADAAEINVLVHGVARADGNVRVELYDSSERFGKEDEALQVLAKPAELGDMNFAIPGVAPGQYAVVAYHDENANGRQDYLLGLISYEGWGASNNPLSAGVPQFAQCSISVSEGAPTAITINIKY